MFHCARKINHRVSPSARKTGAVPSFHSPLCGGLLSHQGQYCRNLSHPASAGGRFRGVVLLEEVRFWIAPCQIILSDLCSCLKTWALSSLLLLSFLLPWFPRMMDSNLSGALSPNILFLHGLSWLWYFIMGTNTPVILPLRRYRQVDPEFCDHSWLYSQFKDNLHYMTPSLKKKKKKEGKKRLITWKLQQKQGYILVVF